MKALIVSGVLGQLLVLKGIVNAPPAWCQWLSITSSSSSESILTLHLAEVMSQGEMNLNAEIISTEIFSRLHYYRLKVVQDQEGSLGSIGLSEEVNNSEITLNTKM